MKILIKCGKLFFNGSFLENSSILVEHGVIQAINPIEVSDADIITLKELTLLPGFIDIHVHGGNGYDTMDATFESINEISKFKLREGVTSFCPTTVTASIEDTRKSIDAVKTAMQKGVDGAEVIGTFLEGPYISSNRKGAHRKEFIKEADMAEIKQLVEYGKGFITSFAIAPEKTGAMDAIEYLIENNINVRLGHSDASLNEVYKAIEKGANVSIHTFNAMSPLDHREPGMVGAVLLNENIYAEIICDLIHVSKEAIKILVKCKGSDKIILVTDCMMAGGLEDGEYTLGQIPVFVRNKIARMSDGTLAGSTLNMMDAVKNMVEEVGVNLADAIKMATANPAKSLGIFNTKGSIAIGKDADLIAIDENYNVKFSMVKGIQFEI